MGRPETAEQALLGGLALAPGDVHLLCAYAELCATEGQPDKAARLVERAAALDPHAAVVFATRVRMAYALGDDREAERISQEFVAAYPEDPYALALLGNSTAMRGDVHAAYAHYRQAAAARPADASLGKATLDMRVAQHPLMRPLYPIRRFGPLQKLGETFLDADYAANPATVGFVPPVTYEQAAHWLGSVEGWVSLARQARANPDYDISKELALPARLPPWAEAKECPPEYLASLRAAIPPVREHAEIALFALTRTPTPKDRHPAANRLRQLAAGAETATTYATNLHTTRRDDGLLDLIESTLRRALSLWFHVGQLAAMPRLLTAPSATPPPATD